jgi:hypothetical protein
MDALLLRMAIAATGATGAIAEPMAADDAWCTVTSAQAECVVHTIHRRYKPDWRPFMLQVERRLAEAPGGSGTLLTFEIPFDGKLHSVLLVISADAPRHRLAFLTDDERVLQDVRQVCRDHGCLQ